MKESNGIRRGVDQAMIVSRKCRHQAIVICAVLCQIVTGCVAWSLPKQTTSGSRIVPKAIQFIQVNQTTRSEILSTFGEPQQIFDDPRVTVYLWMVSRGVYAIGIPGPSFFVGKSGEIEQSEMFLILFDEHDRVQKFQLRRSPPEGVTQDFARHWANEH